MRIAGIDNGVSGTICFYSSYNDKTTLFKTPTFSEKNFQKTVDKNITRIHTLKLTDLFIENLQLDEYSDYSDIRIALERPMINNKRLSSSFSAIRALEATLIVIEDLGLRDKLEFLDSRSWQRKYIPFLDGAKDLKEASLIKGNKLYPQFEKFKHPDRDAVFIMEYAKSIFNTKN